MKPSRTAIGTLSVTIALAVALTSVDAQQPAKRAPKGATDAVIFSLTKYDAEQPIQMEPIVIVRGGRYVAPPVDDEAGSKRFTDMYHRSGRQYRVVFGGGDAGTLTVQKNVEPGCVGLTAEVVVQTTARLGGEVHALAVSSDRIGRGESSRRAPTDDERAAAMDVARAVFARRGVGAGMVKKMKTVNLTALDIDRDGKFEMVGSFQIEGANYLAYNLFIILEPTASGKYRAAWNWYHKGGEAEYEDRRLVDAVDLDGDGTAEVIAGGHYYESNDYVIYKRQAGVWRPVYRGGGGGC